MEMELEWEDLSIGGGRTNERSLCSSPFLSQRGREEEQFAESGVIIY